MKTEGIFLCWIVVKDIEKAIKFYTEVAGLTLKEYHPEYRWAELSGPEGSALGIGEEGSDPTMKSGTNAVITVAVDNIEEAIVHFKKNHVTLIGEVIEIPGHVKMQTCNDSDGNKFQLVQKLS